MSLIIYLLLFVVIAAAYWTSQRCDFEMPLIDCLGEDACNAAFERASKPMRDCLRPHQLAAGLAGFALISKVAFDLMKRRGA